VAHYTFDQQVTGSVVDSSGNKRDGVLTGGQWIADGQFGGALHFSGADYVEVDNFPDATRSFSASLWVRSANTPLDGYETLLSTETAFQGGWQMNLDKVTPAMGIHVAYWDPPINGYTYHECYCVTESRWVHLAFVLDAEQSMLFTYVDGILVDSTSAPRPIVTGSPSLYIGRWAQAHRLLIGDLDDIAIYSRALVPAEITELQTAAAPDPE
jgi:hypothetical protein